ncbi:hypothetical protein MUK42_05776 [Musa troglodytarum]|uniref:Uncharacterized protein n=1 Tax=Musa troglodytarum TaxID=320322 RepID=A0A9E7LEX4_9LILI|nr:hypothetical protein MUK42_05776 [Musa troglodytarum]
MVSRLSATAASRLNCTSSLQFQNSKDPIPSRRRNRAKRLVWTSPPTLISIPMSTIPAFHGYEVSAFQASALLILVLPKSAVSPRRPS